MCRASIVSSEKFNILPMNRAFILATPKKNESIWFQHIFFLLFLSPVKESCLILLQTIPDSIDIEVFKADLLKRFDDIVSVHDLHIWQMTSSKYVSTVHILFHNPQVNIN